MFLSCSISLTSAPPFFLGGLVHTLGLSSFCAYWAALRLEMVGRVAEPTRLSSDLGKRETLFTSTTCIYDAVTFQLFVSETHGGL